MQVHTAYYTSPWGTERKWFCSACSLPVVWFDGVIEEDGSTEDQEQDYPIFEAAMLNRLNKPPM